MENNIDLINNTYFMWQDRGVAISNLHMDDQGICLNAQIAEQTFDIAMTNKGTWGIFRHGQMRREEPITHLTDGNQTPAMGEIIRAMLHLGQALDNKRTALILPSRQDSAESNGYLIISATRDEIARWRVMEDISSLNIATNVTMKRPLEGAKELTNKAIQINDPEAVKLLQKFLSSDNIGIIPSNEIKNLGHANFIDVELKSNPNHSGLGIYGQNSNVFYGNMPSSSRIDKEIYAFNQRQHQEEEQKQTSKASLMQKSVVENRQKQDTSYMPTM